MAYIVKNIGLGDNRLQIGAEEILRQMPWGTRWTYIRIGLRFFVHVNEPFDFFDFSLGVVQSPYGKTTLNCLDAFGVNWNPSGGMGNVGAMGYTVSPPTNYWNNAATGCYLFRKSGSTMTGALSSSGKAYWPGAPYGNSTVSACYVDLTKTATGGTSTGWAPATAANAMLNVTRAQHIANFDTEAAPNVVSGTAMGSVSPALTLAFTSNQLWDTVSLVWSRSTPVMDVHDLSVSRFY